jgi:hypothetical protein
VQQAGLNKGRETAMRVQRITVLTTIVLGAMVFASPVMAQATRPQPSRVKSYWQNLKRSLTTTATTGEVHKNVPAQAAATRG